MTDAKTLPAIGKFHGMPVVRAKLRQEKNCKGCRAKMAKGAQVYRPVLGKAVNGIIRCDRICGYCMAREGNFLKGS